MDSKRQIIYWKESSLEDMSTAQILIEKERFLHGLFSVISLLKKF